MRKSYSLGSFLRTAMEDEFLDAIRRKMVKEGRNFDNEFQTFKEHKKDTTIKKEVK